MGLSNSSASLVFPKYISEDDFLNIVELLLERRKENPTKFFDLMFNSLERNIRLTCVGYFDSEWLYKFISKSMSIYFKAYVIDHDDNYWEIVTFDPNEPDCYLDDSSNELRGLIEVISAFKRDHKEKVTKAELRKVLKNHFRGENLKKIVNSIVLKKEQLGE